MSEYSRESSVQISDEYVESIKQQPERERAVMDKIFFGKSLVEIAALFTDPESDLRKVFNAEQNVSVYAETIQDIAQEVKLKGMFTPAIEQYLAVFPTDNHLRFNIEEAVAREILNTVDFQHLKTLQQIQTVLEQLKRYLHGEEHVTDSAGNMVDINQYIDLLRSFIELRKANLGIRRSLVNIFTSKYGLRGAIEEAIGKGRIVED